MSNNSNIKDLFIVDKDNYDRGKIKEIAHDVMEFAKISKEGVVLFEDRKLNSKDKIKLALVVRFIAHTFSNDIDEFLTIKDFAIIIPNERKEAVGSRLSELVKSGFARKVKSATYSVYPSSIEPFITSIKENGSKLTKKKGGPSKGSRSKSGIGRDIQELVDNNFFETPKTIKEIEAKLEQGGFFHDSRVIDMTIRRSFMKTKNILKRLKNPNPTKAKWVYVIKK